VQEVGKNLSRFQKSRKLRRESVLRMQARVEDTGFAEEEKEAKAETFGTWKIF
jgi:hypothetical protein